MMTREEFEEYLKDAHIIKIDLIAVYNHEIQSIIGVELQQLLVMLYFQGDESAKRQIQEYCYKILKEKICYGNVTGVTIIIFIYSKTVCIYNFFGFKQVRTKK